MWLGAPITSQTFNVMKETHDKPINRLAYHNGILTYDMEFRDKEDSDAYRMLINSMIQTYGQVGTTIMFIKPINTAMT